MTEMRTKCAPKQTFASASGNDLTLFGLSES
jgi:hypothetical protein